jgi:hypothetical protein
MRKWYAIPVAAVLGMTAMPVNSAVAAEHQLTGAPDGVIVEVASIGGTGCPPGTAQATVSGDMVTVTYTKFSAQTGGSSWPDNFSSCQLDLKVSVPKGFTYAISSADFRGNALLQIGASGILESRLSFQGRPGVRRFSSSLYGPYNRNWQINDIVDITQLDWAACDEQRLLQLGTVLTADPGTSDPSKTSRIGMDGSDGANKAIYRFGWKTCPRPGE